jgi:CCDC81 eukaryotic HU domain 2
MDTDGPDLIAESALLNANKKFSIDIYREVWRAVNLWMESRLMKMKGAGIQTFGTFSWENRTDGTQRPMFFISKSQIRNHHVKGHHYLNESVAGVEEINYSAVALKHSRLITKDMVFVCVHHLICVIETYFASIKDFTLKFSFGVLKHSKRKLQFIFDVDRLLQILPNNVRLFEATTRPSTAPVTARTNEDTIVATPSIESHMESIAEEGTYPTHIANDNANESSVPPAITTPVSTATPATLRGDNVAENMHDARKQAYMTALSVWLHKVQTDSQRESYTMQLKNLPDTIFEEHTKSSNTQQQTMKKMKDSLAEQLEELRIKRSAENQEKKTFSSSFFMHESGMYKYD